MSLSEIMAGLKQAVNSTISTSDFKPLNEMIEEYSTDKTYIADKTTLDSLVSTVGKTNDSGGGSTSGTIAAKLNSLISTLGTVNTNVNTNKTNISTLISRTANLATDHNTINTINSTLGTVNTNVGTINTKIGTTSDGWNASTYNSGSMMSKLNRLLYNNVSFYKTIDFIVYSGSSVTTSFSGSKSMSVMFPSSSHLSSSFSATPVITGSINTDTFGSGASVVSSYKVIDNIIGISGNVTYAGVNYVLDSSNVIFKSNGISSNSTINYVFTFSFLQGKAVPASVTIQNLSIRGQFIVINFIK